MKTLIGLLLLCQATAYALPARYSISGDCYGVATDTRQPALSFLNSVYGLSGLDCQNAYENLGKVCHELAIQSGFTGAEVYRDVQLRQETSTKTTTREAILNSKQKERFRRTSVKSALVKQYFFVPIVPTEAGDCRIDRRYPQETVPTLQGRNWGG
jgi:hypothetical protein